MSFFYFVITENAKLSLFVQIAYGLLFSLVITFISDALGTVPNKASVLSQDASFRREFHEIVR